MSIGYLMLGSLLRRVSQFDSGRVHHKTGEYDMKDAIGEIVSAGMDLMSWLAGAFVTAAIVIVALVLYIIFGG